jgi:hypothetical protein
MILNLIFIILFKNLAECTTTASMFINQTCGTTIYAKIGAHPLQGRSYGNRIGRYTHLGRGYDLLKGGQLCMHYVCKDNGFKKMIFDI